MKNAFRLTTTIIATFVFGTGSAVDAQEHQHPAPEKLGRVQFPNSCKDQEHFERAVALLHSFAYSAAEKAFRDVIKTDPNCAMAHWGLAMTCFHPLWEPHFVDDSATRGQAEINEAKRIGGSPHEVELIDALTLLYHKADSVPYAIRAQAYAQAMKAIAERNPNDVESQVFYALALLATASPSDKTHRNDKSAVDLLEPLFQRHPEHPGIPHYLIHACDNAEMAPRGLTAAREYSKIAPSAPHALHMPSHIYTRLGMWEDSIASNMAARKAAHEQEDLGEELHAMDYLTYAYLQLGRDADAERVLKDLGTMSALKANEFKIGYAASAIPARYAIERRQWPDAARLAPVDGAQPQTRAITLWARAVGLARSGNGDAARQDIGRLFDARQQLRAGGDDYWAQQVDVQIKEASAWAALADKNCEEAIQVMRSAADEEDAIEKRPVTPGAIVPAREQLADLLLETGDADGAVKEFDAALAQTPKRRGALEGRGRANKSSLKGHKPPAQDASTP